MENRHGLAGTGAVTQAVGTAEREESLRLLKKIRHKNTQRRITAGADKHSDTRGHVAALRKAGITPHVAMNETRNGGSAIAARTTRHPGYGRSQTCRKMIEGVFGWGKQHGTMRKATLRGLANVASVFMLNLIG